MCWGSKNFIDREQALAVFADMIRLCRKNARIAIRRNFDPINAVMAEKECILTTLELADSLGLRTAVTPHKTGVYKNKEAAVEVEALTAAR